MAFRDEANALGLSLSEAQLDSFEAFEQDLYEANETRNLTRVPREEAWIRHFLDSLLFQDLIPESSTVLDIGTGPGFPAWPLACARPDLQVMALDSNGKMLAFLRELPLRNLEIVQGRAEEWLARDRFDVVTGRAVAPLTAQLEISTSFCKLGGALIPMRGASDAALIETFDPAILGLALERIETRPLPRSEAVRLFPIYRKIMLTPARFPRRWSEILKKPL